MNIEELVDNFSACADWEDKYAYLIDLGGRLPPMDESLKTEATKVQGCMSQVWMLPGWRDGRLHLLADSDAAIVRGLIAVLLALFTGRTKEEAAAIDVAAAFEKLGLDQHLSPNRRNGFFAMVERIRGFVSA